MSWYAGACKAKWKIFLNEISLKRHNGETERKSVSVKFHYNYVQATSKSNSIQSKILGKELIKSLPIYVNGSDKK